MSQNERAEDPSCKERQREQVNGFELLIYHETHRPRCVDRCSGGGRCRFDGKPVGFFRAFLRVIPRFLELEERDHGTGSAVRAADL